MVEVPLRPLGNRINIATCLDLLKLSLESHVLGLFDESEPQSALRLLFILRYHRSSFHFEHFRISRPVGLGLD